MSSTEDKIKVMQAFVDCKKIEVDRGEGWESVCAHNPMWDWEHRDYRIKPEPIVRWVNVYPSNSMHDNAYKSREEADSCAGVSRIRCVKLVEVEDND